MQWKSNCAFLWKRVKSLVATSTILTHANTEDKGIQIDIMTQKEPLTCLHYKTADDKLNYNIPCIGVKEMCVNPQKMLHLNQI